MTQLRMVIYRFELTDCSRLKADSEL